MTAPECAAQCGSPSPNAVICTACTASLAPTGGTAMIRDQMDREHSASIRRHYRHLDDLGGQPPAALLDELAKLAERHADDILAEETSGVPRPALPSPEAERAGEAEDQLAEAADTVTDYRAALNDMQEDRDRYRQLLADAGHIAADKGVTLTKRCEAIRQLAERELAVSDA